MTREERYIEYDGRIDRYLRNQMSEEERATFEHDVDNDDELRKRLVATSLFVRGIAQEGMRREGQAQLNAIKQMSERQFKNVATGGKLSWIKVFGAWAAGIAAALALIAGFKALHPTVSHQQEMAREEVEQSVSSEVIMAPAEPTLASLADEYNKPFGGEPDEFVAIRQEIKKGRSEDMMAVAYDIDKVAWPTAKHGPKGADDEEEIKNTIDNYRDCTHWYTALAYLKSGDEESAIKELEEVVENGKNEELVSRAEALLKRLKE